jgi:GNAT superfamily N-acetyltransferase
MDGEAIIRQAQRGDLVSIGRLGATLVRQHHGYDPARFLEPPDDVEAGYAWFLGTQLDEESSILYVADRGGEILGYIYATLEPMSWMELRGPAGFVHDVVVAESARRLGLARRLMEAAIAWLEKRGAPRTILWTASANAGAHEFFRELGFRATMQEMTREAGSAPGTKPAPPAAPSA